MGERNTEIYCCGCVKNVNAKLVSGKEIYPHRKDLHEMPFWICQTCKNYVGCHYKTSTPTKPLGNIPTKEIRNARNHIHKLLDPIWISGKRTRESFYAELSRRLGYQYHTAEIKSVEDARAIYKIVKELAAGREAASVSQWGMQ